jgi:hypothetical protein
MPNGLTAVRYVVQANSSKFNSCALSRDGRPLVFGQSRTLSAICASRRPPRPSLSISRRNPEAIYPTAPTTLRSRPASGRKAMLSQPIPAGSVGGAHSLCPIRTPHSAFRFRPDSPCPRSSHLVPVPNKFFFLRWLITDFRANRVVRRGPPQFEATSRLLASCISP